MLLMKKPATMDYIMATANEELVCESKYQSFINTRKYEEPGSSVSDHRVCGNVSQPAYGEESLHDVHNPEGGTVIPIVEHKGSVKLGLFLDQCFKFGNFETGQEDSPIYDKRQCNADLYIKEAAYQVLYLYLPMKCSVSLVLQKIILESKRTLVVPERSLGGC